MSGRKMENGKWKIEKKKKRGEKPKYKQLENKRTQKGKTNRMRQKQQQT